MYVACRELKLSVPGEDGRVKVVTIAPGKPVPGVESWNYPNVIAHLNMQMIKWVGDENEAPHNAHRQRGVVIPAIFRKMAPKTDYAAAARERAANQESPGPQKSESPQEPPGAEPSTVAPVSEAGASSVRAPETQAPPAPDLWCCGKTFKSVAGLKSHQRAHTGDQPSSKGA